MVGMLFGFAIRIKGKRSQLRCTISLFCQGAVVEVSSFSNENQIHRHQSVCILSCRFVVGSLW